MADFAELIARLEKATGPDREIDNAIADALGFEMPLTGSEGWPLYYTGSIDAARTLVDGFYWLASEGRTRDNEPLGGAQVFRKNYLVKPIAEAEHERVEIALCIAALKARSIVAEEREGEA